MALKSHNTPALIKKVSGLSTTTMRWTYSLCPW